MMDLSTMVRVNKQQAEKELRQRQTESRRFFSNLERQLDKRFLQEEQDGKSEDFNVALYLHDVHSQIKTKMRKAGNIVDYELDKRIESVVNS